jgi:hypothetical protein
MGLTDHGVPRLVGVITLTALLLLFVIRRGFGGVSVSVGS